MVVADCTAIYVQCLFPSWLFIKVISSFQSEVKETGWEEIEHLGFNKNNFLFGLFVSFPEDSENS